MKKFSFFWTLLLLLGVVSVATSCDDDDVPAPNVTVSFELGDLVEKSLAGELAGMTTWIVTDVDGSLTDLLSYIESAAKPIALELPNYETAISTTLAGTTNLESITLGDDAQTSLVAGAFTGCTDLVEVVAPYVTTLGNSVFDLSSLEVVTLGDASMTVGTTVFGTAGDNDVNIALTIYVDGTNVKYTDGTGDEPNELTIGSTAYTFSKVTDTNPGV